VNVPPEGLLAIDAPVTDYYRISDVATDLMQKSQYQAAVAEWQKALELVPSSATSHNNLGFSLVQTGRVVEAIPHYEKALELSPDYAEAHNNFGLALAKTGRPDQAVAHYEKALELNPELASAHINLGVVEARANRIDEAIRHFEKAIACKPDPVHARQARLNLGLALATAQRWAEAIPHFLEADKLSGGRDPVVLDLLGSVYAELGRYEEALRAAQKALAIASQQNRQGLVEALKARIASYESRMPPSKR
jgi:tetratricopeptide (TPR) repeat protein